MKNKLIYRNLNKRTRKIIVTALNLLISKIELELANDQLYNLKHIFLDRKEQYGDYNKLDINTAYNIIDKKIAMSCGFKIPYLTIDKIKNNASWEKLYDGLKTFRLEINPVNNPIITELFLTKNNILYREPKKEFRYDFSENEDRLKIIKILANEKNYMATSSLYDQVNYLNEASLRKTIGSINRVIKYALALNNEPIEGRKNCGYRINPIYKITTTSTK